MPPVMDPRILAMNQAPVNPQGDYVLYWMTANRRTKYNFALDRALHWVRDLNKPLLILEALRVDYPHASRRLHAFIVQGMSDNAEAAAAAGVGYYPYLEPYSGAGKGLLAALAAEACVVVADWSPVFFLPRMLKAAASKLSVCLEAVDSIGLTPLAAPEREYNAAHAFRRYLQKNLPGFLAHMPQADPLSGAGLPPAVEPPPEVLQNWPATPVEVLNKPIKALAGLPIDLEVEPTGLSGGHSEARTRLLRFLKDQLEHYADKRNDPNSDVASGLSPYLHFGHISAP